MNIWCGAVSSGKTFTSIDVLERDIKHLPPGDAMIIGVNRGSIQRNILNTFYNNLGWSPPSSKNNEDKLFGRNLYFVGANDEGAVKTIQGSSLVLAYVDEATRIPEPFWKMLESRMRIRGARIHATCNPDTPAHWLKKDYIDRADNADLDIKFWNFTLDDNPSLDPAYVKRIKASYTGMWYKRYILGEWCAAHGIVYDQFDHLNIFDKDYQNPNAYIMGIDYGTTNATAAVLCAVTPKMWPQIRIEDEYYYDSAKKGRSKTDEELVDDIKEFIGWRNISAIYVDPSAASLKLALRRRDLPVIDANNDVLLGIKIVSKFIAGKNLLIRKNCTTLLDHIQSYSWDSKAAERGEDKPLKVNDHIVDALRYCVASAFKQGEIDIADESITIGQLRRQVYGEDEHHFLGQTGAGGYF